MPDSNLKELNPVFSFPVERRDLKLVISFGILSIAYQTWYFLSPGDDIALERRQDGRKTPVRGWRRTLSSARKCDRAGMSGPGFRQL